MCENSRRYEYNGYLQIAMRKITFFFLFIFLLASQVFAWPLNRFWSGGNPWWLNDSLTFWAPFDDPANPLYLVKGTGSLSFTRATAATYVHPTTGLVTSAASGQLRIESNGALIEGQRTNLALWSETLGLAATWVPSNMTVDNNTVVAPDGATTAETLTASADNATLLQSYTGTVAAYTGSYYLKRKTGTGNVQVSADNTTWTTCTINASTWTRCSDTRTVTVATYYHGIRLATNTDAVYAWGGDAELGAFASSYIGPTDTAAVTRNKDVLTAPVSGNFSEVTGTITLTVTQGTNTSASFYWDSSTPNADAEDGNWAYLHATQGTTFTGKRLGVGSYNIQMSQSVGPATNKVATTWSSVRAQLAKDGVVGTEDTSTTYSSATPSTITIGRTQGADYIFTWGHIKDFRIWNRSFSDSELQTITAP